MTICLALVFPAESCTAAETVEEIIDRVKARAEEKDPERQSLVFQYLRQVAIEELGKDGSVRKRRSKIYRAYTDERDQELVSVDGRQPTPEEKQQELEKNRKRQRRFLNRSRDPDRQEGNAELMDRNMKLFGDKFSPRLEGEEEVGGRLMHVIALDPVKDFKLDSRTVDRVMNKLLLKVWIDAEDYEVARLEGELTEGVSFFGGLAGALKGLSITVTQKRLETTEWVDERVKAFINARLLFKALHFRVDSVSEDFKPVPE